MCLFVVLCLFCLVVGCVFLVVVCCFLLVDVCCLFFALLSLYVSSCVLYWLLNATGCVVVCFGFGCCLSVGVV